MIFEELVDDRALTLFAGYRLIAIPLDGNTGGVLKGLVGDDVVDALEGQRRGEPVVSAVGVYDQVRKHVQILVEAPLGASGSIGLDRVIVSVLQREDEEVNLVDCSQIQDPDLGLKCGYCHRIDLNVHDETPLACPTCDRDRRRVTVATSPAEKVDKVEEMEAVMAAVASPDCGMGVDAQPVTTPAGQGCDVDPGGERTI